MSTFAGTAEHYRKYRPGIPRDVAEILAAAVPDRHPRRLLDIGTGTGLVVEALLTRFDDIIAIAIDTDADMWLLPKRLYAPKSPKIHECIYNDAQRRNSHHRRTGTLTWSLSAGHSTGSIK